MAGRHGGRHGKHNSYGSCREKQRFITKGIQISELNGGYQALYHYATLTLIAILWKQAQQEV
jgi:hypothetical protein